MQEVSRRARVLAIVWVLLSLAPSVHGATIDVMIVYDSTAKAKGRWAIKVSGNWRLTFD